MNGFTVQVVPSHQAEFALSSAPGLIDLPEAEEGIAGIVMESMQAMLLNMALYQCRADWETRRERQKQGIAIAKDAGKCTGRKADTKANAEIIKYRAQGHTIAKVARLAGVSESQVKLILKKEAASKAVA